MADWTDNSYDFMAPSDSDSSIFDTGSYPADGGIDAAGFTGSGMNYTDLATLLAAQGVIGTDQFGMPNYKAFTQDVNQQVFDPSSMSYGSIADNTQLSGLIAQHADSGVDLTGFQSAVDNGSLTPVGIQDGQMLYQDINGNILSADQLQQRSLQNLNPSIGDYAKFNLSTQIPGAESYQTMDTPLDMANAYTQASGLPIEQSYKSIGDDRYITNDAGDYLGYQSADGKNVYYSDLANAAPEQNWLQKLAGALRVPAGTAAKAAQGAIANRTGQASQPTTAQSASKLGLGALMALAGMQTRDAKAPAPRDSKSATAMSWKRFADGGKVSGQGNAQGALGLLRGGQSGQADTVPAKVSHGEYVMDADVVSALGDGNTNAGAAKLDQMREEIRKHKRSAPAKNIPPKAKNPTEYIKGA